MTTAAGDSDFATPAHGQSKQFGGNSGKAYATAVGPKGYPVVGILPLIRKDPLNYLVGVSRDFQDVIPLNFGPQKVFMVTNPEYIERVFRGNYKNYQKSNFYRPLRPVVGRGMLLAEGKAWKSQRQAAQPAFHKESIARMTDEMSEAINDMLAQWRTKFADGKPFDLSIEMTRLTLDVLLRTLLNVRLDDQTDLVFDSLMLVLGETEKRIWNLTRVSEFLPTPTNRAYHRAVKVLEDLVDRVIEKRRRSLPSNENDLLALLFSAYADPDTGEPIGTLLRDEIMTSVIAGHETTAAALTWTICHLSKNPAIERLVRLEAQSAYAGASPTMEDVPKLSYTTMVISEALRLSPPAWTMSRIAMADDELGPYKIQKGATIMLSPYIVHRNAEIWENPEGFDPERFTPERIAERHPFAYFPFGGGPRGCIGERFALLEAQLAVAMISTSFRVDLLPGASIEPKAMITLRPKDARVTLHKQPTH